MKIDRTGITFNFAFLVTIARICVYAFFAYLGYRYIITLDYAWVKYIPALNYLKILIICFAYRSIMKVLVFWK